MDQNFPHWLTEQMIKGIRGFNLDAYLVALEGWRRGLTLRWYYDAADVTDMKIIGFNPLGKTFSLSSKDKTHVFYRSRGDCVENRAVEITSNKDQTKDYLIKANVPTPSSKRFTENDPDEDIIHYGMNMGFPIVIKPTFGSLGKGVVTNIQSETELRTRIKYVRNELGYSDVMIERYLSGTDMRLYVAGDRVLAATKRLPANVVGDGQHTIKELIDNKNEKRKGNRYLQSKQINIDQVLKDYLDKLDYSIDSIPVKGEFVRLKGQSNIAAGGDPVDVTNDIIPEVKNVAINAVKAISGLYHAGVDVIVNDDNDVQVIEINATADIGMHLFPLEGKTRNIPEGIIDFYFPETVGKGIKSTKIYYDHSNIIKIISEKSINQIEIADAPVGTLYAKRYVVSGKVQGVGYRRWVRKQAIQQGLNGYTRNLRNGKVVVVVAGNDKNIVEEFEEICAKGPSKAEVNDIKAYVWEKQIKAGFEIRKQRN